MVAVGGLAIAGVGVSYICDRAAVGHVLNLSRAPWTVSDVDCHVLFATDVLKTCSFSVAPADFPRLLAGWKFEPVESTYRRAHDFPMALERGPNFRVGQHFLAQPGEFPHGGSVDLLADAAHSRVLVHLYIE